MKILLVTFLIAMCMCSPRAEAIIGFSKESCDKAYKTPPAAKKTGSFKMVVYKNERATTACFFYNEKCVGVLIENLGMTAEQAALIVTLNLARGEEISDLKRDNRIEGQKVYKSPSGRIVTYSGDMISIVTPVYFLIQTRDEVLAEFKTGKPNPYKTGSYKDTLWKGCEAQRLKKN